MAISKFQNYETQIINRSEIKNAEYNPRIMDKSAKKRLKDGLAKHGLVSALTYNKRTGNLVGGHQRLEQLDNLEKNKNYELTVCVVDVPEKEEAILNVYLNNPSVQGEWDLDKLANMALDFSIDLGDMGFSDMDKDFLFDGDDRFSEMFENKEVETINDNLNKVKEARKESAEKLKDRNRIDFYSVIVFKDAKEREDFYKKISVPFSEEYLTQEQIERLVK